MAKKTPTAPKTKRASTLHTVTYENIIKLLIDLRKSKNLSQGELGRKLDIPQPHLSVLEKCGRNLTIIELLDIIDVLTDGDSKEGAVILKKIQTLYYRTRKTKKLTALKR